MTSIQSTQDYNLFKRIKGNRQIKKAHVNKLRTAIEADPQIIEFIPILINEKWEVIDGQHRFEAIKQLGLPVYYQQANGLTLQTVQALNSNTKSWGPNDYAQAYSELGNQNYVVYLEHRHQYHLNHDITMHYAGVGHNCTSLGFKNGKFRVGTPNDIKLHTQRLLDISQHVPHWDLRSTAVAFLKCSLHPDYDHERMLTKLSKLGPQMERFTQIPDAIRAFETIYNHGLSINRHVRFY